MKDFEQLPVEIQQLFPDGGKFYEVVRHESSSVMNDEEERMLCQYDKLSSFYGRFDEFTLMVIWGLDLVGVRALFTEPYI